MFSRLTSVLLLVIVVCSFASPADSAHREEDGPPDAKRYKFLYFVSMVGGSHYSTLSMSAKALVRRGHHVVSLVSSSNSPEVKTKDADVLSVVVFNSSYTERKRADVRENIGKFLASGSLNTFWGPVIEGLKGNYGGELDVRKMRLQECDDLLGDTKTMKQLREEKFDMLVADDHVPCVPLVAQALDIPFVQNCVLFAVPSKHGSWAGLPVNPSYIPERVMGLTHQMTFFQRVQNVLSHAFYGYLWRYVAYDFNSFDQLKIKYNIKPDVSAYESNRLAVLYIFHASFALEFPRPLQPNTIYLPLAVNKYTKETVEIDVARFLDEAPNGVVLFSLGTFTSFGGLEWAQIMADGFALLPQRVLWQGRHPVELRLGNNTRVVQWLPLSQVMEHVNVKIYVSHAGGFSMYEALWAGIPMVGLPLYEDQMDNMVRMEDRGAGLALDITSLTAATLSQTIQRVITEPKFRASARRISLILRDLYTSPSPVETAAHWILHVTKFGGDHLRPAVQDLNSLQRNLLDVYLFIGVVAALVFGGAVSLFKCCCKCICGGRTVHHLKGA